MANAQITAHVVVEFSDGDSPNVSVEVDTRPEGYNHGASSFTPGQSVYLLLYVPPGWVCSYKEVTAGALTLTGTTSINVEDYLTFIDDDTQSLSKYPTNTPSFSWLGVSLGAITVVQQICSILARVYNTVTGAYTPPHRIGLAKANYSTQAQVYRISSVPVNIAQVAALFVVSKS